MQIVPLTKQRYADWDKFCLKSDGAWFWHTTDWLCFQLDYRPSLQSTDCSFMVIEGDRVYAICPLLEESVSNDKGVVRQFTMGGGSCMIPAFSNDLTRGLRTTVERLVFERIDQLALEHSVVRVSLRYCPLAPAFMNAAETPHNRLMYYGYANRSLNTQILDLHNPLDDLHSDMSKGHCYDVRRGMEEFEVTVFDAKTVTSHIFDKYQETHHIAAGRITRPQSTFDMMFRWIAEKKAVLIAASDNNQPLSFAYLNIYKNGAYYSSSATLPNLSHPRAGHAIQGRAIEWLREQNYRYYEIGWQQYSAQPYDFPSDKELRIAAFKRHFGGQTVPLFMGEKFYSSEYYRYVAQDSLDQYTAFLDRGPTDSTTNMGIGRASKEISDDN